MDETSIAMSAPETIVAPDSDSMSASEAPVETPEIRQLVIKLAPILTGGEVHLQLV